MTSGLEIAAGWTPDRLDALDEALRRAGVDALLIPRGDRFRGEQVPPADERLAWATGFTGSAGAVLILPPKADSPRRGVLFVDGRYTLQAAEEVDTERFPVCHLVDSPPSVWVEKNLAPGTRLGVDPWLFTPREVERLNECCTKAGARLVELDGDPVAEAWADRPGPPLAPAVVHELTHAGRTAEDKRAEIAGRLVEAGQHAVVLSDPHSVAWLLNMRGADVPNTPLALAFALLHADRRVDLFLPPEKVGPALRDHLGAAVAVREPAALGPILDALGSEDAVIRLDPEQAPLWFLRRLETAGAKVVRAADPCALPRACKNPVELEGARAAHRRDGVALCRFLAWLDATVPTGAVSELAAVERLEALRREHELCTDASFATIAGAGPHGAIVHYRVTPATNRQLRAGELFLLDSGGQYLDGTTDVTRTIALGRPQALERRRFTQVLKGHIALARAVFPAGTSGSQLDTLARQFLWLDGVDYDHGTGHGVGSYLSVHEGPQRISRVPNQVALKPGMILSNEPGYYKPDAFGIRIENLVAVVEAPRIDGAERDMLAFETLTLAPIDRRLIDPALLSDEERAWVDAYHARVLATIGPLLPRGDRLWLDDACAPLTA
ncbi:aminopeptidase P family protein [Roseospirillum parvum]|uniref:Xaa-Pro aminopeptidase n=1 Tax=Roseospirillum parvum TaxID=83401 RepID=A0A1G8C1F1_9PROT|nr:aminopeptidase P family protein [Roseospirillum parvum]SDH39282.1 Xaa-Pro aminopeptidase [Roseospirillum parvum]